MVKSIHSFIDRSKLQMTKDRLKGCPKKVPGSLILTDVLKDPTQQDIPLIIRIFGETTVHSALSQLVEKGKITPTAAKTARALLPESNLFRTL
ncbi:hypothetical protein DXI23_04760 [Marinobacter flavimaris]|uniref:Uncharacterized protein n=1 Tax=Marinobacter flavimaris TaxID=262076 RepID=A0A3D8H4J9_9GAMM|nr:hypothetical protein MDHKLMBL_03660 [Marinobacter flavimaris]RDU41638.1 hypothetical protein DXI23_04760 [Marinobacter flavimaris]